MSRPNYDVKETYTGTGSLDEYTFDFKIEELSQLLVIEVDDNGVETQRVRGTDTTYLSGVVYDSVDGGGTVTLAANLTAAYTLMFLLANDAPTQPFEFFNKQSFNLRRFESAYDYLGGQIQRLAYLAKQSIRIHDIDDEESFDTQLPPSVIDAAGKMIIINLAGDGLDYGPTVTSLQDATTAAQTAADAAQDDVDALEISTMKFYGPQDTDGSWREGINGDGHFVLEERFAGVWITREITAKTT